MTIRLGTRGSKLADAGELGGRAARRGGRAGHRAHLGRRQRGGPVELSDKARFVKELEEALLAGEIDLAVHSAKDVPGELPDGLAIVGVPGAPTPATRSAAPAASMI